MKKDAVINISLKADSGYKSVIKGRISPSKWGLINKILAQNEDYQMFSHQDMIDFGSNCVVKNHNKENGTIKDYLEHFINEKFK